MPVMNAAAGPRRSSAGKGARPCWQLPHRRRPVRGRGRTRRVCVRRRADRRPSPPRPMLGGATVRPCEPQRSPGRPRRPRRPEPQPSYARRRRHLVSGRGDRRCSNASAAASTAGPTPARVLISSRTSTSISATPPPVNRSSPRCAARAWDANPHTGPASTVTTNESASICKHSSTISPSKRR